jgi:arylsulfatase A-like enzyme
MRSLKASVSLLALESVVGDWPPSRRSMRSACRRSVSYLWAAAVSMMVLWMQPPQMSAADRPNILWILSEDTSIHYFEHFFPGGAPTPQISALAKHGLTFTHAFSNAPVCSVARTTLISGCYAPRIGTQYHRRAVSVPMPMGLKMFPAYLKQAGYYTSNCEKKDYNAQESPGTWDESSSKASWRNRPAGTPFFHMQTFTTTHESSLHFPAEDLEAQPTITDPGQVALAPYHPDTPTFRYTAARYRDRIRMLDEQVGELVAELAQDGLLEETFIFYFGDHGGVLPRGKGYAYESGLHVPLVVRVPEKYRGLIDRPWDSQVAGFVSFIDFGPTVLHLAGAAYPAHRMDGKPFLGPGIDRHEVDQRQSALGYADRFDEKYDLVRSLRLGKYAYIRSYQPMNYDGLHNNYRYQMLAYREWRDLSQAGKLTPVQEQFFQPRPAEMLFDIEADPHELRNLAGDPAFSKVLLRARAELQYRLKSWPDLSFYPESFLAEEALAAPVPFGQKHRLELIELIDIADLPLQPWDEAGAKVRRALTSDNPWKRYWGLIAANVFGAAAEPLRLQIEKLALGDDSLLVRVRAAEYLAMSGHPTVAQQALQECVSRSRSGIELGLILNSVVLLRDRQPSLRVAIDVDQLSPEVLANDGVQRRLEYLTGHVVESKKKKNKKKPGKQD